MERFLIRKRPLGINQGGIMFKSYEKAPLGLRPSLIPKRLFEAMRVNDDLPAKDENGNDLYAIAYSTLDEAMEMLKKGIEKLKEKS